MRGLLKFAGLVLAAPVVAASCSSEPLPRPDDVSLSLLREIGAPPSSQVDPRQRATPYQGEFLFTYKTDYRVAAGRPDLEVWFAALPGRLSCDISADLPKEPYVSCEVRRSGRWFYVRIVGNLKASETSIRITVGGQLPPRTPGQDRYTSRRDDRVPIRGRA